MWDSKNNNITDCFRLLPLEIREDIAAYLPTSEILNLRYVSRTMAAIFTSHTFWKTRFHVNGERGFLSYLIKNQKSKRFPRRIDWRLLYHCTNEIKVGGIEFQNRKRIWHINRWLRDTTSTIRRDSLNISLEDTGNKLDWKEVCRGL
jgi:hypothetical protein